MDKAEFRGTYHWQLHFPGNLVIPEGFQVKDPNNVPTYLGEPYRISLHPVKPGYQELFVDIPPGCSPVFQMECTENLTSGRFENMVFQIGYRLSGGRTILLCSDVRYRKISVKVVG